MEYLGQYRTIGGTYECYRNQQGYIEGYKTTGGTIYFEGQVPVRYGGDCKRIVSLETTPEAFCEYVRGLRNTSEPKAPDNQLTLF